MFEQANVELHISIADLAASPAVTVLARRD